MVKEVVFHYNCLSGRARITNRRWFFKGVCWLPICCSIIHATEKLAKSGSLSSKGENKVPNCLYVLRKEKGMKIIPPETISPRLVFRKTQVEIRSFSSSWNQTK